MFEESHLLNIKHEKRQYKTRFAETATVPEPDVIGVKRGYDVVEDAISYLFLIGFFIVSRVV